MALIQTEDGKVVSLTNQPINVNINTPEPGIGLKETVVFNNFRMFSTSKDNQAQIFSEISREEAILIKNAKVIKYSQKNGNIPNLITEFKDVFISPALDKSSASDKMFMLNEIVDSGYAFPLVVICNLDETVSDAKSFFGAYCSGPYADSNEILSYAYISLSVYN